MHRALPAALSFLLSIAASAASATTVVDPAGDFLSTYTGPAAGDVDILSATATFDGTAFHLASLENGAIGTSVGSLFVWGINRGAGTARLALGTPSVGATVLWDAGAGLFPARAARVVTFPAAGAPTITPLLGAVTVAGNSIEGLGPVWLLPATGFLPGSYTFTLWSRRRVDPAVDGTNAEIADFAPNAAGILATPEPGVLGLLLGGALAGGVAARRRRRRAPA